MARLSPRAARGRLGVALWLIVFAVVVAGLAAWIAGEVAAGQEAERVDSRLAATLQVAAAEFDTVLTEAEERAAALARAREVQEALATGADRALERLAEAEANVLFLAADGSAFGEAASPARRAATVMDANGRRLGRVVVAVPLDSRLLARLRQSAGARGDSLAVADGRKVLAGMAAPGDDARSLSMPLLAGTGVNLVAFALPDPIDERRADARRLAVLAALVTLALLGLLGWLVADLVSRRTLAAVPEGPSRRARDAIDEQRSAQRMREAVSLVGDALAASHDPEALLPVILESAIGATGAAGARLVSDGNEIARAGSPERGGAPLALRLGTEEENLGLLLLYPPRGRSFDAQAGELAHWLAGQASIALENAHLHRAVERQAVTDDLTQLANRRRFSEMLALEVRRAERFGDPLALVLADLDDFKLVNDRYGHQSGDRVLCRFADVLRENVREVDLAARYGGEEFALLLPDTGLSGAARLAKRLARAFNSVPLQGVAEEELTVTASFGVAAYPQANSVEQLLTAADRALYRAKAAGKNRVFRASERDLRTK
jgi:diguanylate cyclase (GGDEF)-like protein